MHTFISPFCIFSGHNDFGRFVVLSLTFGCCSIVFYVFTQQDVIINKFAKSYLVTITHSSNETQFTGRNNYKISEKPLKLQNASTKSTNNYVTMNFKGRLGNEIFEYASLYGIARHNHMIPVVDDKFRLRRIFKISLTSVKPLANIKRFREAKACAFDEKAFVLDKKYNWTLSGYLQSWKYFIDYSDDIRKELRLQDTIQVQAIQKFNEIVKARNVTDKNKLTYIAVHVRRGDMLNNKPNVNLGYTTANVSYVNNAMSWFKKKYPSAFFIFASDDIAWCKANFNKPNTAFITQRNSAEVDMAILSRCNHSIITTGTYGWWSAWLSGGQTIYYKDFPRKGSGLDRLFDAKTYFPPNWIAMSHL